MPAGVQSGNPSVLSDLPKDCVISPDSLNHHYLDIIHCVAPGVEVGGNWLLGLLVSDVCAVTINPFLQCLLCLAYILAAAYFTLDEVYEVGGLAGGKTPHVIALPGSLAGKLVYGHQCRVGFASRSSTHYRQIARTKVGLLAVFLLYPSNTVVSGELFSCRRDAKAPGITHKSARGL